MKAADPQKAGGSIYKTKDLTFNRLLGLTMRT